MKIHVITDDKGNIVATVHGTPGSRGDKPVEQPIALPGYKVKQVELPKELEGMRNAEQLHKALKSQLG
jgi:hypothetical protein